MAPIRARTKLTNTGAETKSNHTRNTCHSEPNEIATCLAFFIGSQQQSKGIARGIRPLARLKVSTQTSEWFGVVCLHTKQKFSVQYPWYVCIYFRVRLYPDVGF